MELDPSTSNSTCSAESPAGFSSRVKFGGMYDAAYAPSLSHFALQSLQALHFADYAKALGVNKLIYQLATLDRAIFIENKHRHVLHIVVERIAERDHLDQRREKEKNRVSGSRQTTMNSLNKIAVNPRNGLCFMLLCRSSRAKRGTWHMLKKHRG